MPLTPNYCTQCGAAVETRVIEDRRRSVCPRCGTIHYTNPLPVAAALVLNERREVLLVRRARPPREGLWCLPMGFAEIGETIAAAAGRELHEETGISAHVVRLLDADSYPSDHYGDLLIVTFEFEKTGGTEQAGSDALAVGYFPLGQLPPLAFASNEKAIRACGAAHLEGWEIEDSFVSLEARADKALLSDALVELLEQQTGQIVARWLADVRQGGSTPTYTVLETEPLAACAAQALSQLGRWLKGDEAAQEIKAFYRAVGRTRRTQGVRLHELLSSLSLLKKHLWTFAREHSVWRRPIEIYRVLEFDRLLAEFFDRAAYHVARGFDE